MRALLLLLAVGCTGGPMDTTTKSSSSSSETSVPTPTGTTETTDPTVTTQTTSTTSTTDTGSTGTGTLPEGLYGQVPDAPVPLPAFSGVLGMDGLARTSADLVGQPTVMWFYPAAFTGG